MHLLDHVSVAVADLDATRPFCDVIIAALGCEEIYDRPEAAGYGALCRPGNPLDTYLTVYLSPDAIADDKRHRCFKATSQAQVRAFHAAGLANGGCNHGPPGLRPRYHVACYASFVRDPDGDRLEAVCHLPEQPSAEAIDMSSQRRSIGCG
jgi:catechol 2,3-dioxygenase-like lactoylglutathione lyase family enzyme